VTLGPRRGCLTRRGQCVGGRPPVGVQGAARAGRPGSTWQRRLATRRRRTCPSASRLAKKTRLATPLLLPIKPWRPLRPPRTRTTPRVMRPYTAACLIKSSCLIRPALYLIGVRKSTSFKEPLDPAPAFSLPVSQALQPRLKEQMPRSPY
jgi:hypothetical protein